MKLFASLFEIKRKQEPKSLETYQEELAIKIGRQQFEKLKNLGLHIPVRLI